MLIRSLKTEHHVGGALRWIPIFPELAPLLSKRYAEAAEGESLVLPMLVGRTDASLRKPIEKAIKNAGLTQWPRLWHNLRATRQTELENEFPSHVVCAWLGNNQATARAHYLQVTDEHFEKGAAQNAAQSAYDNGDSDGQRSQSVEQQSEEMSEESNGDNNCHTLAEVICNIKMLPVGTEQQPESSGNTHVPSRGAAESTALDTSLAVVIRAWPVLDQQTRDVIVSLAGQVRRCRSASG